MRRALFALSLVLAFDVAAQVTPIIDCWTEQNGSITVFFGYTSMSAGSVTYPIGAENFTNPPPVAQGQPEVFLPGTYHRVFAMTVPLDQESEVSWTVGTSTVTLDRGGITSNCSFCICPPGPQGVAGVTGSAGDSGPKGPDGDRGATGLPGSDGATGEIGDRGPAGADGPLGPAGDPGPIGPAGAMGPIGLRGERGGAGDRGKVTFDASASLSADQSLTIDLDRPATITVFGAVMARSARGGTVVLQIDGMRREVRVSSAEWTSVPLLVSVPIPAGAHELRAVAGEGVEIGDAALSVIASPGDAPSRRRATAR